MRDLRFRVWGWGFKVYLRGSGVLWGLKIHKIRITLRTLNYGNYGICLTMGNAGCISSTVVGFFEGFRDTQNNLCVCWFGLGLCPKQSQIL